MAEVQNQLRPLEQRVDRATNSIERLYNTNGGPEGYLQTARREDNNRFKMIFDILDELKQGARATKDFIQQHQFMEQQTALAKKDDDKRFNRKMAKWMLAVTLLIGLLELIAHNLGPILRSLADPPTHSQVQQSTVPNWRQ